MNKTLKFILIVIGLIATFFAVKDIIMPSIENSVAKDRAASAQWRKNKSYKIPLHR
jgi:hypothetical protein